VTDKLRLPRLSPSFIAKEYRLEPITLRRLMGGRYEKYVLMPSRLASLSPMLSVISARPVRNILPSPYSSAKLVASDDIESLQQHFTLQLNAVG
jgi:hypothetical protein